MVIIVSGTALASNQATWCAMHLDFIRFDPKFPAVRLLTRGGLPEGHQPA